MKKTLLVLSLLLLCFVPWQQASAQSDMPHYAFSTAGTTVTDENGASYSYTIGQAAFSAFGNTEGSVELGVQNVFCIPTFDTFTYEICQDNAASFFSILPEGTTLPANVKTSEPGQYQFLLHAVSDGGCDSLVWITLVVHPNLDTDLYAQAENCYRWFGQDYNESGDYQHHLSTVHGCDSTLNLHLSIIKNTPIPVIYVYLDRVLMVNHNQEGRDRADYYYYRWYRDGQLIAEGDSLDSYQNDDDSKLSGCYYLEVATDASKQYWVKSDTICLGTTGIVMASEDPIKLSIAPNPVTANNVFHVTVDLAETLLQGAKVCVYDAQGRKVVERSAMRQTSFVANFAAGVYSVHLITAGGRHAASKLVVR